MTPFEEGYKAALDGKRQDANPYDADKCPKSCTRWDEGWKRKRFGR